MYRLNLFGGASLEGPSGPLSGPVTQQRRLALLAYLAVGGSGGSSRDKLIALLWPDVDEQRGRRHLSQSLYIIRQALGSGTVDSTGEVLRLEPDIVRADCTEFDEAIESSDFESAVNLYGGSFLDGFYVREAAEFEEWTDSERRRFSTAYAEALESLALGAEESGDPRAAARWWEGLSAHDPYNSRSVVGWMRALVSIGDPGNAVQVAREHEKRLRVELDLTPAPEVGALLQQLRESKAEAEPGARATADAPQVRSSTAGLDRAFSVTPQHPEAAPRLWRQWWPAAAVTVAIAIGWLLIGNRSSAGDAAVFESVAVLPFMNLTGNPERDYLAEGIADELISALSRVPDLRVPAQTSSFHFRSGGIDARAIGDSLGVEALLEGSIKEEGDRIRVTVQLIDARDGLHRFTETYDRRLESHLDLQVEIARATIAALGIDLPVGWSPVRPQTGDTLAWYYYAKARHWWRKRTQAGTDTALVYFRRATERDSNFVNAWAGRVNAYATGEVWDHLAIDDSLGAELWAIIDLALRLDPNSVEALIARATGLIGRGEIEAAEKDYLRILELNPNFALGHLWYADLLSNTERYEAALREARRADELDPMSPIGKKVLADILRNNLRLDEAVQQYDYAIQLEPSFASPVRNKAWALVCMGLFEDARRTLARLDELDGEWPYTARMVYLMGDFEGAKGMMQRVRAGGRDDDPSLMAYILTEMGRYDDARAEYRKAADRAPGDPSVDLVLAYVYVREGASRRAREIVEHVAYVDHDPRVYFNLASIYGALGDRDRAFELLEQAHAGRKPQIMTLKVNPRFIDLRGDPRFASFLDQVGLR